MLGHCKFAIFVPTLSVCRHGAIYTNSRTTGFFCSLIKNGLYSSNYKKVIFLLRHFYVVYVWPLTWNGHKFWVILLFLSNKSFYIHFPSTFYTWTLHMDLVGTELQLPLLGEKDPVKNLKICMQWEFEKLTLNFTIFIGIL